MAIVKMKKLRLVCLRTERRGILDAMQKSGCVELISQEAETEAGFATLDAREDLAAASEKNARAAAALASLERYAPEKKGLFAPRDQADADRIEALWAGEEDLTLVCREIERCEAEIADVRQRKVRLEAQKEQIEPLRAMDIPLEQIRDTSSTQVMLGTVHQAKLDELTAKAAELKCVQVAEVGRLLEASYVLVLAHKSVAEEAARLLVQVGFTRMTLRYDGTAREVIASMEREMAEAEAEREKAARAIAGYVNRRADLQLYYDLTSALIDREEASQRIIATRDVLHMTGWVPESDAEKVELLIAKNAPYAVAEFSDPEEGDVVPTFLVNNRVISPYEAVTSMFSTPSQDDVDPTPRLMPFFAIFFGMMVSDAAYGVFLTVMGIVGGYVLKMRGMLGQISKILIIGGLATVFWGTLFGSWFGIEGIPAPLFNPLENPLPMLGLCCGLGLVHLFTGILIKAGMALKQGDWQTAVFDQFCWIFLILGIIVFAAGPMLLGEGFAWLGTTGMVMALIGFAGILLFAGRASKNPIMRIFNGLGSLYGISSYLGDILSYARLFAMGLATGVICMVFNRIAGMVAGNVIGTVAAVLILVVGHTFNLGINALGAYVHSCRLQYIEYFGKFFDGGGRAFKPLTRRSKYVDLTK